MKHTMAIQRHWQTLTDGKTGTVAARYAHCTRFLGVEFK